MLQGCQARNWYLKSDSRPRCLHVLSRRWLLIRILWQSHVWQTIVGILRYIRKLPSFYFPIMMLSLWVLSFPDCKLLSVDRLVSVMALKQYCCMSIRLFHISKRVSVLLSVVFTGKYRVTTCVYRYFVTVSCAASNLRSRTGSVSSHVCLESLARTFRAI